MSLSFCVELHNKEEKHMNVAVCCTWEGKKAIGIHRCHLEACPASTSHNTSRRLSALYFSRHHFLQPHQLPSTSLETNLCPITLCLLFYLLIDSSHGVKLNKCTWDILKNWCKMIQCLVIYGKVLDVKWGPCSSVICCNKSGLCN